MLNVILWLRKDLVFHSCQPCIVSLYFFLTIMRTGFSTVVGVACREERWMDWLLPDLCWFQAMYNIFTSRKIMVFSIDKNNWAWGKICLIQWWITSHWIFFLIEAGWPLFRNSLVDFCREVELDYTASKIHSKLIHLTVAFIFIEMCFVGINKEIIANQTKH